MHRCFMGNTLISMIAWNVSVGASYRQAALKAVRAWKDTAHDGCFRPPCLAQVITQRRLYHIDASCRYNDWYESTPRTVPRCNARCALRKAER